MRIPEALRRPVDEWVIIAAGLLTGVLACVVLPVILWLAVG